MATQWGDELHSRIAEAVKARRKENKISAEQLADECERLGYPISRSTLANYESGRKRRLDVSDLMVIAAALQVSPLALLFPGDLDEEVEIFPGQMTTTLGASSWFVGDPKWLTDIQIQLDQLARAIAIRRNQNDTPAATAADP
jgi:transcriptional regulator with XRE-family HTH domain